MEARCLTEVLTETRREDIPYLLPPAFYEEEKRLRNKLLMFRLKYRNRIDLNRIFELDLGDVEPRLKQATASFTVLFANIDGVFNQFREYLRKYQDELIEERSTTLEGKIVKAIFELTRPLYVTHVTDVIKVTFENKDVIITSTDIAVWISENLGEEVDVKIIGKKIKSLGLKTELKKVEGNTKRVLVLEEDALRILFKRYIPKSDLEGNEGYKSNKSNKVRMGERKVVKVEDLERPAFCELW